MKVVAHVPGKDVLENPSVVERFRDVGIGVELQLTAEVLDTLTLKDFAALRRMAGDLPVTVHAPFMELNPGASDPYVLKATERRFSEAVVAAKVLSAELMVFHTGYHPQRISASYSSWFGKALKTFTRVLKEWPGKLALENVFDTTPENLKNFLEHLPERVGVCIDVGHLNLFSSVPFEEWFEELGDRVYEFHLHDNAGVEDSHLPLGEGSVNFVKLFNLMEKLRGEYILNLENKDFRSVLKSLEYLRRNSKWRGR